jgi:hypothetical protein
MMIVRGVCIPVSEARRWPFVEQTVQTVGRRAHDDRGDRGDDQVTVMIAGEPRSDRS